VSHIPPHHKKNNYYRKIDIWKKEKDGRFNLTQENLLDIDFEPNEIITKTHFPISLKSHTNKFHHNKLIQWKFGTTINPLQLTQQDFNTKKDDYYIEKNDVYLDGLNLMLITHDSHDVHE